MKLGRRIILWLIKDALTSMGYRIIITSKSDYHHCRIEYEYDDAYLPDEGMFVESSVLSKTEGASLVDAIVRMTPGREKGRDQ